MYTYIMLIKGIHAAFGFQKCLTLVLPAEIITDTMTG